MANGHGGARPGAGRPQGSKSGPRLHTRELLKIAETANAEGILPLEVMLRTMRALWEAGEQMAACKVATDAAPYLHPRLAATTITGDGDGLIIRIVKFAEMDEVKMIDGTVDAVH